MTGADNWPPMAQSGSVTFWPVVLEDGYTQNAVRIRISPLSGRT
jgi:hypothetical protein